jgi:RimJ/RimL family protein N-acetyltransferase
MPFAVPWTDAIGTPGFMEGFLAYHHECRESWQPDRWRLNFGTWAEGELAGTQGIEADDFATTRQVMTGSWLGQRFQRRGFGTEQRAAVLALAFDGLGAQLAMSGAIAGNVASARVSEKLGYERAGQGYLKQRGTRVREQKFRLTREQWRLVEHPPVEIHGLEACLPLFGL